MLDRWVRSLFDTRPAGETKQAKPPVEQAIAAWENDPEKNPEGYKIVRGRDGKPVEVILVKNREPAVFAVVVNGTQEQFEFGGKMKSLEQAFGDLMLSQFINRNIFNGWVELKGIQRLDAQVSQKHQGFVFGAPGEVPVEYRVTITDVGM